jgi:perosamine synthetase
MSKIMINQIEPGFTKKELFSVKKYLNSKPWITEHTQTRLLEKNLANYTKRKYCIMFSNGTITLSAILHCLGIGKDDEVIVPGYTMIATANAPTFVNAITVLCDIEKDNLCMCPEDLVKKITKKTKAVIYVTLNGRTGRIDEIKRICKKNNIFLIEDSAHSLGSYYKKKHHGNFGIASSMSFSMPKIITMGQGGCVLTDSKQLEKKLNRFKNFGRDDSGNDTHNHIGYNFKITDMQSVLCNAQLANIQKKIIKKKKIFETYKKNLKKNKNIKFYKFTETETPWFVDIYVNNRKSLIMYLKKMGIDTRKVYPAISKQKIFKNNFKLKNCEQICKKGLWLPSSLNLKTKEIQTICKKINKFFSKN